MKPVALTIVIIIVGQERVRVVPAVIAKVVVEGLPRLEAVFVLAIGHKIPFELAGAVGVALALIDALVAVLANVRLATDNGFAREEVVAHAISSLFCIALRQDQQ